MFQNANTTPITFANWNAREGFFQIGKKDERKTFTQVRDVTVKKISTMIDTYDNKDREILQLRVNGKEGDAVISFNLASGSTAKLVGLLSVADLAKPLGMSGQMLKAGTTPKGFAEPLQKDLVSISVFQDGWIQLPEKLPEITMVKVGNKDVADTSARDEYVAAKVKALIAKFGTSTVPDHDDTPPVEGSSDDGDDDPFNF